MKLAFYKADRGTILDRIIDGCSGRDGYSHVELVFADGTFFSSSPRDRGTRFKRIAIDDKWELVPLPVSGRGESLARAFCLAQAGKRYDWAGVFRFLPPFNRLPIKLSRGRWFCSEICTVALQRAGLLGPVNPVQISPNTLRLIVAADIECKPTERKEP